MKKRLPGSVTPPRLPQENDRARELMFLRHILAALSLILVFLAIFGPPFFVRVHLTMVFVLLWALISAAGYFLLRAGLLGAARTLLVWGSWLLLTIFLLLAGGMSTAAASFYVAGAAVIGIVHGTRLALSWAVLSSLSGLAIIVLDRAGIAPPRYFPVLPLAGWLDVTVCLVMVLVAVRMSLGSLRSALSDARHQLTEREKAEKELVREKTFTEALISSLPGILLVLNEEGKLVRWNANAESVPQPIAESLQGQSFLDMIVPSQREWVKGAMRKPFEAGSCALEVSITGRGGLELPYFFTGRWIAIEGGCYFIGLGLDISERRRMEKRLRQAEKMEAVGTMAGGIAHDFNNILGGIFGSTELAILKSKSGSDIAEPLAEVLNAAERARDLIQQLLTFSRGESQERKPLTLAPLIKEATRFLRTTVPGNVEVKLDIRTEGRVFADPVQVHQVLLNLTINAAQAMKGEAGTIEIVLREATSPFDVEQTEDLPEGAYVRLDVTDSGSGIDPGILDRIFEPYFTTKESGEGTGLGLAVVQSIVASHQGRIFVHSRPNRGTSFHIYFPHHSY